MAFSYHPEVGNSSNSPRFVCLYLRFSLLLKSVLQSKGNAFTTAAEEDEGGV